MYIYTRKTTFHCDWHNVTQLGLLYRLREMNIFIHICI